VKILRTAIFLAGVASLVLFTALLVVAVTDFVSPGAMPLGTAVVLFGAVVAMFSALVLFLYRGGFRHGRA
jgi:hypothetical protein